MQDPRPPRRQWLMVALAAALLAVSLPIAIRELAGPTGAIIHVRWQPSVDDTTRGRLEARFHLTDPQPLEGDSWRYELIDTSRENIRQLIEAPEVADTHHLDRPAHAIASEATRTARRLRLGGAADAAIRATDATAAAFGVFSLVLIVLGLTGRVPTRERLARAFHDIAPLLRRTRGASGPWVSRAIPEVDELAAGVFRLVFGAVLVVFFATHRFGSSYLGILDLKIYGPAHASILEWYRAHPYVVDWTTPWLLIAGVAFTAGVRTRVTYPLFVAGVLVWSFMAAAYDGTHPHSTLVLTLVALLPARWGERLSVERFLPTTAWQAREATLDKAYGYAMWLPGFVFGVAFAAAAWAKVAREGANWVLNGTIKYHFITDSVNAPVDWGLQLAGYPTLAIVGSFFALTTEAVVISAAFVRSDAYRGLIGCAAFSLLAGFYLFMGVFWAGWWVLLLGFVPWQRLVDLVRSGRRTAPIGTRPSQQWMPLAQTIAIAAVVVQQVVVSAIDVERPPMFSPYPMYSHSFESQTQYNDFRPTTYRLVAATDGGTKAELICQVEDELVEDFRDALAGSAQSEARVWRALQECGVDAGALRSVTIEGDRNRFDWQRLKLEWRKADLVLGPLAPHDVALTANAP